MTVGLVAVLAMAVWGFVALWLMGSGSNRNYR